jgi:ABC-type amino acid transport substrate-binding protein
MFKMKSVLGTVAAATVILALSACGATDAEGGGEGDIAQPLKMGVINNFPPFEYVEDGELTGFDIELVNAILDAEGLEGEWVVMGFDGLIPALQSGQIDLAVSDISVNEERKAVVDFSDPYYNDGQAIAVKAGSDIQSLEDLAGKTIVSTQGTSGNVAAQKVADEYGATVQTLASSDALYLAVTSGQADALVIDTSAIQYRIATDGESPSIEMLGDPIESAPTAIAIPKGNDALVERLNAGLKKIKDDGTYDKLRAKYLPES